MIAKLRTPSIAQSNVKCQDPRTERKQSTKSPSSSESSDFVPSPCPSVLNCHDTSSCEAMRRYRINKSCDQCRDRKVRCNVLPTSPGLQVTCNHCQKRNEHCQFSTAKRAYRASSNTSTARDPRRSASSAGPTELFIDRLLHDNSEQNVLYDEFSIMKVPDQRSTSSSLAIFSEQRLNSLTERLGSPRLKILVNGLDDALRLHLKRGSAAFSSQTPPEHVKQPDMSPEERELYISRYFDHVQPIYPFLDRADFEASVSRPDIVGLLNSNPSFSALYHAILALGCLYEGGGEYDAGSGTSWALFTEAKRHLPEILIGRESLQSLQALVALSIYSMTPCCLQVNHPLLAQASRMVLALRYHKSSIPESNGDICQRIFWVIYHLDKQYNFQARNSSVIADYDICCPIPTVEESIFGKYDWFRASIGFSRILSVAYETVFSISAMTNSTNSQLVSIDSVQEMLEDWRISIPVQFRPREASRGFSFRDSRSKYVAIQTHYYYHHLVIALERLTLHLDREGNRQESKRHLMDAARGVIELTRYIDVEAYTPIFIQAIMPLSALLILFDFIVHNSRHSETSSNLILLDVVSGHFGLLDLASKGSFPGSCLTEFSHLARQFVSSLPEESAFDMGTASAEVLSSSSFGASGNTSIGVEQQLQMTNEIPQLDENNQVPESLFYPAFEEDIGNFDMQYFTGAEFWPLFGSYAPD